MDKILKVLLLALSAMILAGCSQSAQVEDQAYVIAMGIDRIQDDQILMTVLIPQIAGGDSSGGSSSGKYKKFSVEADDYEAALEKLNWAASREPDLAQMKLIVLSDTVAKEKGCRQLIKNIAQTERLYTATKVAVCEGEAGKFIEAIQPNIGTRVSNDIDAMFEHYAANGYVPVSTLADLYYKTESVYSDPMVAWAMLDTSEKTEAPSEEATQVSAMGASPSQVSSGLKSDNQTRYLGAAVFVDGCMAGILNGKQTVIANLLRNEAESILYEFEGQSLRLVPARTVRTKVDTKNGAPRIRIDARLSISAQEKKPDENALRSQLEADIRETIEEARKLNADPFGFAEKAAVHFLTFDTWTMYQWHKRLQQASVEIELRFAYSDT